jgi:hypothetical protein
MAYLFKQNSLQLMSMIFRFSDSNSESIRTDAAKTRKELNRYFKKRKRSTILSLLALFSIKFEYFNSNLYNNPVDK